jgi:hypothetical protein
MFKLFYRIIILLLGWKLLDEKGKSYFKEIKKSVLIYPHTTYMDFVTLLIFKHAYDLLGLWVVVNEGIYNRYPKLFDYLSCFPATSKEKNNGNFVQSTVSRFKDSENYHILISPEGTLKKVAWRSGYYYLSKELKIPINIVGFDYVTHEMKFITVNLNTNENSEVPQEKEENKNLNEKTQIENLLQKEFKQIIPLYPECSYVKINTKIKPSIFGNYNFFNFSMSIFCIMSSIFIYIITGSILMSILIFTLAHFYICMDLSLDLWFDLD